MADIKMEDITQKLQLHLENKMGGLSFFESDKWMIRSQNVRSKFFNRTAQFWIIKLTFMTFQTEINQFFLMAVRFQQLKLSISVTFDKKGFVHSRPILTEYRPFSIEPSFDLETDLSQSQPSSRSYPLRIQTGNNYDVNGGQ